MKRIIASILLVAIMLLNVIAMASCGKKETPDVDDIINKLDAAGWQVPAEGYDGSAVTIKFYHTMSATTLQPTLNAAIAEFNKLYPNITIEHQQVGGYPDVLSTIKTELTQGNEPNIAYCYPDHVASYNIGRAVVPLDNLINSTIPVTDALGNTTVLGLSAEQLADFIPVYYNEGKIFDDRGTMYTMPLAKSTEAIYYDKTFFAEHNLTVPTTWEELEAVCAQIKAIDPYCIPFGYDSEDNWFITMCEQSGSGYTSLDPNNHFLFNNDTNKSFVEMFKRWYDLGYVTTKDLYGGAYTSELFTSTTPIDVNGTPDDTSDDKVQRCYMLVGSTGGASYQEPPVDANNNYLFETGMAPIPQVNPDAPKAISQGPSLCIFDKKDNPQEVVASWLFVKYLSTNPAFQAQFSLASGYATVIKSARELPTYVEALEAADGYGNMTASGVKFALQNEGACFVSPAFNGSSDARKQSGLIIIDVLGSDRTDIKALIDEKFAAALQECNYVVGK